MNGIKMHIENEIAKHKFKMIFGVDADNYHLAGTAHINMVAEYGKFTGDFKKSLALMELHLNVQEKFASVGYNLSDDEIRNVILKAIH